MALDAVQYVKIDGDGVFKYVLIELKDKKGKKKTIVRGFKWAEYHADIMDRVAPRLSEQGLIYECIGGGRIKHDSKNSTLFVYGYSVGFGQANHAVTVQILRQSYPSYPIDNISFSNSGY